MDAALRAQKIREKRRMILAIQSDDDELEFEVVIPTVLDLIDAGLDPIIANVNVPDKQREDAIQAQTDEIQGDVRKFYPMAVKLLKASMVNPRLYDEDGECPDDSVTPRDLGNLIFPLANAVIEKMNEEVGEVGTATAKFRMDPGGEAGTGGSADVRDEPGGDTEAPTS